MAHGAHRQSLNVTAAPAAPTTRRRRKRRAQGRKAHEGGLVVAPMVPASGKRGARARREGGDPVRCLAEALSGLPALVPDMPVAESGRDDRVMRDLAAQRRYWVVRKAGSGAFSSVFIGLPWDYVETVAPRAAAAVAAGAADARNRDWRAPLCGRGGAGGWGGGRQRRDGSGRRGATASPASSSSSSSSSSDGGSDSSDDYGDGDSDGKGGAWRGPRSGRRAGGGHARQGSTHMAARPAPVLYALKVFPADTVFPAELAAGMVLQHANIANMVEWFVVGANYYLVHEFVPGTDLQVVMFGPDGEGPDDGRGGRILGRRIAFEERFFGLVFVQVLRALRYCHGRHLAHRDVKLENIVTSFDPATGLPTAKLVDFGFAFFIRPPAREIVGDSRIVIPVPPQQQQQQQQKQQPPGRHRHHRGRSRPRSKVVPLGVAGRLTRRNELHGTSEYCAPEVALRALASPTDLAATDVYSLGATLYLALMGRFPRNEDFTRLLHEERKHLDRDPRYADPTVRRRLLDGDGPFARFIARRGYYDFGPDEDEDPADGAWCGCGDGCVGFDDCERNDDGDDDGRCRHSHSGGAPRRLRVASYRTDNNRPHGGTDRSPDGDPMDLEDPSPRGSDDCDSDDCEQDVVGAHCWRQLHPPRHGSGTSDSDTDGEGRFPSRSRSRSRSPRGHPPGRRGQSTTAAAAKWPRVCGMFVIGHTPCLSVAACDLLRGMLDTRPSCRLTLDQVAEHPWTQRALADERTLRARRTDVVFRPLV